MVDKKAVKRYYIRRDGRLKSAEFSMRISMISMISSEDLHRNLA